jgi:ribonuclease D
VAAALLGHPPQMGYAALVEAELGVRIDKTQTRTDWSRRPLSAAQIVYAANDVAFLPELAARLRQRLAGAGREAWALEDSAALLDPSLYGVNPEDAWERLGGIVYQPVAVQARARRLAAWRERRADQADRPRQWILTDQALLALAAANPEDVAGIQALDVVPQGAIRNSGAAILAELRRADEDLAAGGYGLVRRSRPTAPDNGRLRQLIDVTQKAANALDVAPEILATRAEIGALMRGARDVRPLRGWRRAVIGEALLAALPGGAEHA